MDREESILGNENVAEDNKEINRRKIQGGATDDAFKNFDTYVAPKFPKEDDEKKFISECLADNFIFEELTDEDLDVMVDAFEKKSFPSQKTLIEEGEIGDYFYLINDGEVTVSVDGEKISDIGKGTSFGELALLYNSPRSATCVAKTDVTAWAVDQMTFRFLLRKSADNETSGIVDILKKVPFLSELDQDTLHQISDALVEKPFAEGESVFKKGDIGENFYIVKSGGFKVHDISSGDSQYVDQKMGTGDYFGERALLTGEPRNASVTALLDSTLLYMSREDFQKTCGNLQQLIDDAHRKRCMLAVPIFASSKLTPNEYKQLTGLFKTRNYTKGEFLNIEGRPIRNQGFYIIDKGEVRIIDNEAKITTLTKGDHFGGQGIKIKQDSPSQRTIEFMEDTTCQVLSLKAIESVVGSVERLGKPQSFEKKLSSITFKDLYIHKYLGAGSFGTVTLASHRTNGTFYAVKQLSKDKLLETGQIKSVYREKNIMSSVQHPLILCLHSTFQDSNSLYMVIDLAEGGELFGVIQSRSDHPGVGRDAALFYSACIIESLHHIHSRYIAYRDLKPENVLVDKDGYCILIDFGFSKVVMDKTYSMLGTPEYLAPEVLLSKGYNCSCDYWGYGCMVYELLSGVTPFIKSGMTELELYRRIAKGKYSFTSVEGDFDTASRDIIHNLLIKKTSKRLGCMANKTMDIKNHEYFKSIDWEALYNKSIPAPWKPEVESKDQDVGKAFYIVSSGMVLSKNEQKKFESFGEMVDVNDQKDCPNASSSNGGCCAIQ